MRRRSFWRGGCFMCSTISIHKQRTWWCDWRGLAFSVRFYLLLDSMCLCAFDDCNIAIHSSWCIDFIRRFQGCSAGVYIFTMCRHNKMRMAQWHETFLSLAFLAVASCEYGPVCITIILGHHSVKLLDMWFGIRFEVFVCLVLVRRIVLSFICFIL